LANPNGGEIILYQAPGGDTRIQVKLNGETVWLTQAQMADMLRRDKRTSSEHVSRVLRDGELEGPSVVRKYRTTAADGKAYDTAYYNLDTIIAVGYRVNSHRGTQFRIWATRKLREYLVKGFVMNDERLARGETGYSRRASRAGSPHPRLRKELIREGQRHLRHQARLRPED